MDVATSNPLLRPSFWFVLLAMGLCGAMAAAVGATLEGYPAQSALDVAFVAGLLTSAVAGVAGLATAPRRLRAGAGEPREGDLEAASQGLDGWVVRVDPVYAPMPSVLLPVVGLGGLAFGWPATMFAILMLVAPMSRVDDLTDDPTALMIVSLLVALVPTLVWLGWELVVRPVAARIELGPHRLSVETFTRIGSRRFSIALSDVEELAVMPDGLQVVGADRTTLLAMPDRSRRTHLALAQLIRKQRERIPGSRGDVPEALAQVAAASREEP